MSNILDQNFATTALVVLVTILAIVAIVAMVLLSQRGGELRADVTRSAGGDVQITGTIKTPEPTAPERR